MFRILPLILLTVMMLGGCVESTTNTEKATPDIAVVDTARIFRESDHGQTAVKTLEDMQVDMQKELMDLQTEVQKDPENAEAQQKLQSTYMAFQQRIGAEEQNIINILNEVMQRVIDKYRTDKNLLLIIPTEAALSYSKAVDVTQDIIAEVNKEKVVFTPAAPTEEIAPAIEVEETDDDSDDKSDDKSDDDADESDKK